MSASLKTKYDVIKILRDVINAGLADMRMTGWDCMEYAQASFNNADKIILLNNIQNRRVGWQGEKYANSITGEFERVDEWIEEQSWQVHIVLKRTTAPVSASTVTAEDVADLFVAWLNGRGMSLLRNSGVAPLRIDTETIFVYNDDSDVYQKRAVFTVKLQVPKEYRSEQDALDLIKPDIEPI